MNVLDAKIIISAADKASAIFKKIGGSAGTLEQRLDRIGSRMMKTGAVMTAAITAPVLAFAAKSMNAAADFQDQLIELRKEMDGLTPEQFDRISKSLRSIPRDLPVTLADTMATATQAAEFGVAADDIERFTRTTAQMALAIKAPMAGVGEQLALLGKTYGLNAAGIAKAADATQFYADNLRASESDLLAYETAVGAQAKAAGLAAEQVAALGAGFLSQGVAASDAASRTESLLKKLTGEKGLKAAAKLAGVNAKQFKKAWNEDAGKALDLVFAKIAKFGTVQQRQAELAKVFGDKQAAALLPLIQSWGEVSRTQEQAARGAADGAVGRKTVEQLRSYRAELTRISNVWSDIQITAGEKLLPAITPRLEQFHKLLQDWTSGPEGAQRVDWAVKLGLTSAVAGPALIFAGLAVKAISRITTAIKALAFWAGAGSGALGGLYLALAAVAVAGGAAAWQEWDKIGPRIEAASDAADKAAGSFTAMVSAIAALQGAKAGDAAGNLKSNVNRSSANLLLAYGHWAKRFYSYFGVDVSGTLDPVLGHIQRRLKYRRATTDDAGLLDSAVPSRSVPMPYKPVPTPLIDYLQRQGWMGGGGLAGAPQSVAGGKGDRAFPVGPELRQALEGIKIEAPELKGQATINVRIQVDGPGRVTGASANATGPIKPVVGVDNTGAPRGTERF